MKQTKNLWKVLLIAGATGVVAACGNNGGNNQESQQQTEAAETETETERLYAFFERAYQENLERSPITQSFRGIKDNQDEWGDFSQEFQLEGYEIARRHLAELQAFDYDELTPEAQISYAIFEDQTRSTIESENFHYHNYPVNHFFGWHTQVPSFLINIHRISSVDDAEDYIARLEKVDPMFDQIIEGLAAREERGVMPPAWVYPYVLEASRNVISGAPFTEGEDSTILNDFKSKVDALDVTDEERAALVARAEAALETSVQPAYERLIAFMERQAEIAPTDDGVWRLPDGEAYYNYLLNFYTSTDLTADEVHQLGLENAERIHNEMRAIMEEVGFEGDLQDFFEFMRTDGQFYLENTDEGRQQYLSEAKAWIDRMRERIPDYFGILPNADVIVKRVEPFRENSAGKAFYQAPTPDGSRPGTYYVNLKDMAIMPTYQMEALAYHEGIPGHHMQRAIQVELDDVPKFQRFSGFTAYTEGWGLYSEWLPTQMEGAFYEDPYSDFGRLAMELWRAGRLVVDTGLHAKRWTRQEAIDWLKENTPNPEGDVIDAINRYIVIPGQATAYMIGKLKIVELRQRAQAELGDAYTDTGFHDTVLKNGPMPLSLLEEQVNAWIADVKGRS